MTTATHETIDFKIAKTRTSTIFDSGNRAARDEAVACVTAAMKALPGQTPSNDFGTACAQVASSDPFDGLGLRWWNGLGWTTFTQG